MGTILNLHLKTGIFLWQESRMMLTIISLGKIFTRGEEVEVVHFILSVRSIYRQHSKKSIRRSQFWEPSNQSNQMWQTMIFILKKGREDYHVV